MQVQLAGMAHQPSRHGDVGGAHCWRGHQSFAQLCIGRAAVGDAPKEADTVLLT